ncbi:unnamed protein product [Ranitomeya imitator]|uniref:Reverse transcriptase domain-containing protein n=1 Tax=Ranitomeya imitator TaxID=111125 RepID=A0ABN9KPW0_9NEOB|nr:unnamed protein product [Ranitomeya imitator]
MTAHVQALQKRLNVVHKHVFSSIPDTNASADVYQLNPVRKNTENPLVLLGTDAEKAFDRVDWIFLRETLLAFHIPLVNL